MQMKVKPIKGNWSWSSWRTKNFSTHSVIIICIFFICIFFFLAGFFGSSLFFHSQDSQSDDEYGVRTRPRARLLESTKEETKYNLLRAGESGDNSITLIPFQVLSWRPRALYFPNFLSSEQCQTLIDIARERLRPSTLALRRGETKESTQGIRTSYGTFLSASEDKTGTLDFIEEKIARATKLPRAHFEAFNVLRYEIGQKYNAHLDAFNPAEYGPQKSKRVATFLMYLTDVQEGGETAFPFENGMNMDGTYFRYDRCIGLKVKPRKGDGILFYSSFPNGTIDPTSLHASCPVIKGVKWAATKWIRDEVYTRR